MSRRAARLRAAAAASETTPGESVAPEPAGSTGATADAVAPEAPTADTPVAETPVAGMPTSEEIDAFEEAARAFRIGEQPAQAAAAPEPQTTETAAAPVHVAPRRSGGTRRFVTIGATLGVMSIAGLLAVSMTLPAEALAVASDPQAAAATSLVTASKVDGRSGASDEEIQAYVASSDVQNESLARAEEFTTVSLLDIAAEQGIKFSSDVYTNDPEAAIQWPFMVGVGMTWGYGMRDGRLHAGIDFVPGNGAPIQAIADGTVRTATEQGGGYGVTVYIDHVIDGQVITSHYSHMQYGSLKVKAGDTVKVGDIVGLTGNTGRSYGAHLHFELIVNGSTIDPMPWLNKNAGRYSY
ncbi:M23 family metallopeptidase [Microbacterium sp.]|uniref:M23 family metallopeptidase n=1 Tax=Microbacterium sp. TaxID=51671 RepID=UPI00281210B1|nr:M23 family metallopeptidase [Microbacterium sp.]